VEEREENPWIRGVGIRQGSQEVLMRRGADEKKEAT